MDSFFELVDEDGRPMGRARIATLRSANESFGIQALVEIEDGELERVRLLEGCEYIYEVNGGRRVEIDKAELFVPDDDTGRRGRLRTRLATGRVEVHVDIDGRRARPFAFEVRSTKLGYMDDYRWMLENIAEVSSTLLLERFAPSEQRLAIDDTCDAQTLYQRFVFLRGLLQGERLSAALRRIVGEPYVQWQQTMERVSPGRGLRGGERTVRQLVRPGPRARWSHAQHPYLETLPRYVDAGRTDETLDNVPNRFVLFALEEWRGLVAAMLEVLEAERRRSPGAMTEPVRRGLSEGQALADHIDEVLSSPLFEEVGPLGSFPIANQVLQKKEGYREVLHAYLLVQLGASLSWAGGEDVFGAGQRSVATLYEYWVFLELAKIVSSLCDQPLNLQELVGESPSGMNLILRRERASSIRGAFRRRGREFSIELCFNQQFAPGPNGSWTRSLRPDCSLHIVPLEPSRRQDDVWLHFDAKYRVNRVEELIGADGDEPALIAKTEDLYKMHTYRDAIVRAVGAYVVFPGTKSDTREQYGEVLPGLGAFPLRPSRSGDAEGSMAIRGFLQRAFDHVATQTSKHERARHWRRVATAGPSATGTQDAVDFLRAPPADTLVLLGYVKSEAHHEWVAASGLYNLRADAERRGSVGLRGPELSAELVVLYGRLGEGPRLFRVADEPRVQTAEDLAALGYPESHGRLYFCIPLEPLADAPVWLQQGIVEATAKRHRGSRPVGAPIVVSWDAIVDATTSA